MSNSHIDWFIITERIVQKTLTPIISNQVINDILFGKKEAARTWANDVAYPLADSDNLTRVAQFLGITEDPSRAKSKYLHFLKEKLLALAEAEAETHQQAFLDDFKGVKLRGLTFSQLATALRYPDFEKEDTNPLRIIAALDLPVYLTTSHHHFMEAALRVVGKKPRTEVYAWREGLEKKIPAKFRTDRDFEPDEETPLVYHLHGIDDAPESLVLTEDDYLEFLASITQDFNTEAIPSTVRDAFSSLLLLLGYDLHAWDLRVLLRGLIKGNNPFRPRSFAIQLDPDKVKSVKKPAQLREYLEQYFDKVAFDVYWGSPQEFMQDLWAEL
jgi:hypothetical protein